MLRLFALTTLMLSPAGYYVLKAAAYARHNVLKEIIEDDTRPLDQTWHQDALDWVYPV